MKINRDAFLLTGCVRTLSYLIVLCTVFCAVSYAREITDMAGRKVAVPDRITRVCTDWPVVMYPVYAIDPAFLTGGTNVHLCLNGGFKVKGMEPVSPARVLMYDPEVIIAAEPSFYENALRDPRWQNIVAEKTNRVCLTPRILFNRFDRPPSFMRLLGVKRLTHLLYPDAYRIDIVKEAREFYRLFLNIRVSENTMRRALYS